MISADLEYHKSLLDLYDLNIKNYKKRKKWHIIYLFLCLLNAIIQSINIYSNILKDKSIIFALIATILWLCAASVTYFLNIRSTNKLIKENTELYNEKLKIVDYSKFIKEERTKKLKKLKKLWHS